MGSQGEQAHQQRPEEQEAEKIRKQKSSSPPDTASVDPDSNLDIKWKISQGGNGEISFEDLRSLSIDDLRIMFGDDGTSPCDSPAGKTKGQESSPTQMLCHDKVADADTHADEVHVHAEEKQVNVAISGGKLAGRCEDVEVEEEDVTTQAARFAAGEARSHIDRSGCDPPDDVELSPKNAKRRADPPAGDDVNKDGECSNEGCKEETGRDITFVEVKPESEESRQVHAVGSADDSNAAAVSNGLQDLHQISEIRTRESAHTNGTVCSRSIVSELSYDDHLSVATGHISHFSMSPSELEEEAAEIEAMEEAARVNGYSIHHRILPCVKEESPSEASPDATPSFEQSPARAAATRKKTKIADTTLNQLLKEARDLNEMIDDTELDVTQDDSTRDEDHNQSIDPRILEETKQIQASVKYTESQLRDAERDIDKQAEVESALLGELHELLRSFGISDPLASQKIEDGACCARNAEEEARIALVRSERECRWNHEDSANKAEIESKLRIELKGVSKQLAKVEFEAKREQSTLLERAKSYQQEERNLQDDYKRLKEELEEAVTRSIPADNKPGEAVIESSPNDDNDASTVAGANNTSTSVVTDGANSSQPFDELVAGLSTELSMIIDEQIGVAMAVNENSIGAMSEEEAKATLQEMEAKVVQFEQTFEQLEQAQGKMISPIVARQAPQSPSLPRVLPPPTCESTPADAFGSIDPQHLADAQIVQASSPLKEEDMKLSRKEKGAESGTLKKETGEGASIEDSLDVNSCHGEATADLTLSKEKETNTTKDTSFTMSDAVTDMNLKQYFVPGTPKRLAKRVWRASPKRKAALGCSPKRALGLTCSVIEVNGDQDTVSSIGSRDVVRIAPDTPQRYSSLAKKCHQTCGIMDTINNFWGKQGIPEGDEEQSTN